MDTMLADNPRAVIGNNMPPEPTPFEKSEKEIGNLYGEAALWLDGAAVTSQAAADGLANLLNMLRAAEKNADGARKVEKQPHMDAAKAVDDRYRPLLDRCKLATDGCKKALAPWLEKLEAEKRAAADAARKEAEDKARAAQEAIRAADAANLEARAAAEELVKAAKKAEAIASRAEKDGAKAGNGAAGRAVSLRTTYRAEITDGTTFARYVWQTHRAEMDTFLAGIAKRLVDGGARELPGVTVHTEKTAV